VAYKQLLSIRLTDERTRLPEQRHRRELLSTAPVVRGVWYSLEVRVLINGASSRTETWLDGQPVPALTKTESLGTSPIGRFQLGENISGRTYDGAFVDVVLAPPSI
jgi:hypothetical protein